MRVRPPFRLPAPSPGVKVSCLAASLSPTVPIVLAGTVEGTVFAFHLLQAQERSHQRGREAEDDRPTVGGGGGGSAASGRDDPVGRTELGTVLMKFEHTSEPIEGVCYSQEQVRSCLGRPVWPGLSGADILDGVTVVVPAMTPGRARCK